MTNLINIAGINTVDILSLTTTGKFRFITKCRAGWMTIVDSRNSDNEYHMEFPESIITRYNKGALQTVEFQPEGTDIWLTIFARKGNRIVLIDKTILGHLTVGTINQLYRNTNLYNLDQFNTVGAKTWADRAFVPYIVPMEA